MMTHRGDDPSRGKYLASGQDWHPICINVDAIMRPNPYAGPKFMSKIEPKTLQSSPPKMAGAAAPSRGETAADAAFAALFGGVMLAEKMANGPAKSDPVPDPMPMASVENGQFDQQPHDEMPSITVPLNMKFSEDTAEASDDDAAALAEDLAEIIAPAGLVAADPQPAQGLRGRTASAGEIAAKRPSSPIAPMAYEGDSDGDVDIEVNHAGTKVNPALPRAASASQTASRSAAHPAATHHAATYPAATYPAATYKADTAPVSLTSAKTDAAPREQVDSEARPVASSKITDGVPDGKSSAVMRGQDLKSKIDAEITARLDAKVSGEKAGGGDQLDQFKMRQTLADSALDGTGNSVTKGGKAADLVSVNSVPRSPAAMMVDDARLTPTSSPTAPVVASAALTDSGQFSGQSSGGQSNGSGSNSGHAGTASATTQANLIELLDTAQDNWTEMLLQRVKKGLSGGKDAIEFQLTPRSLGKLKISLSMQNDQTSLKIQTETAAAASLLGESEAKLAQMMETSGLRLAGLTSDHNPRFGDDGANHRGQQQAGASDKGGHGDQQDETSAARVEESTTGSSENLINIQA